MAQSAPILIAGGGIGGLAAALGLAREIWSMTEASQGPQADMTTVAKLYEGWTGVPLRAR